jgi:predicted Fe-S protein YdhL (DUF1289 family)
MNVKSPCVDKCKLNHNKNICDGCYRTADEISNWKNYSDNEKKVVLRNLKIRKLGLSCIIFIMLFFNAYATDNWIGRWIASDQWQSEFLIEIKENGDAITSYGAGDKGQWEIIDGNIEIFWESGKKDYLFQGVMGFQRISKDKDQSYTSGLRKSLD